MGAGPRRRLGGGSGPLAGRDARYHDLGAGYHANRLDTGRRARNHIRQLQALGYTVTLTLTLTPAAA